MLKLTYLENGFHLELLTQSLEEWVNNRVLLALRAATPLFIEPSTAAFLLPCDLPYLCDLETLAQGENGDILELSVCDDESVEVCLQGTWLSSAPECEQGVFISRLSDRAEFFIDKIWQETQLGAFVTND